MNPRRIIVVVEDTGEVLHDFDVTSWSEKQISLRKATLFNRLDPLAVTILDTAGKEQGNREL